jgi:uncharacterized protein
MTLLFVFVASLWAGMQNAFAGGGAFVLLPTMMLTGMDARAANITCTLALFPAQIATGWTGRHGVSGTHGLSFRSLTVISLLGGAIGAVLLLFTSAQFFARLLPWLVLFATAVFAWGSFAPRRLDAARLQPGATGALHFIVSVYGGYFGGGIGFLMLATFTAAGLAIRTAALTKNVLAATINASAVAIFAFSPHAQWKPAAISSCGAVLGGVAGGLLLHRINERLLRLFVIVIGSALTLGLFLRG